MWQPISKCLWWEIIEGAQNNIFGTLTSARASEDFGVKNVADLY